MNRLHMVDSVPPVSPPDSSSPHLNENTHGALLRFARFLHKEGEKKRGRPPQTETPVSSGGPKNPYVTQAERERRRDEIGHILDIYI